jgi:leukotriene A-4 hydrolase/aminopeptidase
MKIRWWSAAVSSFGLLALAGCGGAPTPKMQNEANLDIHSNANPQQVRSTHLDLDLEVLFEEKKLRGTVTHRIERTDIVAPFVVDTRDLDISKVEIATAAEGPFTNTLFTLSPRDPVLGSALKITLQPDVTLVRIHYQTRPTASGLQWLEPAQTAGKKRPFLYSQSQAIHARSWIPLQDSPGVRTTYRARIRTPQDLIAVMSARGDFRLANPKEAPTGDYSFRLPQAIPSYLIALAVGDLEFRYLSTRSGVWAEPSVVDKAAKEFEDTERMIQAAEQLFGPYGWHRYDILVLPPSFPYGGMENPLMTFATPTVIAGDKSLVSLIAHELAHSWSGNLVTNATWRDFWLNEGFTTYFERRIIEAVYGAPRARMEAVLGHQRAVDLVKELPPEDQILHVDLKGRDPEDGATEIPYEKGALFLVALEDAFGRERLDKFLYAYFSKFRFQSITTQQFREFLEANLLSTDLAAAARVPVDEWITKPGLPASAPKPVSDAFEPVDALAKRWQAQDAPETKPETASWNTQQWLRFLTSFPESTNAAKLAALDRTFGFTKTGNSEILFQWLMLSVHANYKPAEPVLERFLVEVGRRKFVRPLFEELAKTPEGLAKAKKIYQKARPGYHPITATTIDEVMRKAGA